MCKPRLYAGTAQHPLFTAWQKFDEDSTASNILLCADDIIVSWDPGAAEKNVILPEQYDLVVQKLFADMAAE